MTERPSHCPLPGTRPEGARDEREAAARVREMFSRIAPRYDFLNHLLSASLDRVWRRRTARRFRDVLARPDARVLDLCCGTGDLAFALARAGRAHVYGSDFAHPMLGRALRKQGAIPVDVTFIEADALSMPFRGGTFDLVTAAFGFRNLANYDAGLREIHRLLKPGGETGILEFSEPRGPIWGPLYRFYFTKVLPRLGAAISGSQAYSYLPSSVMKFPWPEDLRSQMERTGFLEATYEVWAGGIVALHRARRP